FTFQVYSGRYNDMSFEPPGWLVHWNPQFVAQHALLLGGIVLYLIFAVLMGIVFRSPTKWMIAADGNSEIVADDRSRLKLSDALAKFDALHKGTDRPALVLVTAAGGGIRAAYWSAAVLATLQDRRGGFDRHIFAISAVSGGALGASTYKALTLRGRPICPEAQ